MGSSVSKAYERKECVVLGFFFLEVLLVSLALCSEGAALELAFVEDPEDAQDWSLLYGSSCSLPLPLPFSLSCSLVFFFGERARAKLGLILGR